MKSKEQESQLSPSVGLGQLFLLWSQETPSHPTFLSGQEHRYLDFSLTPAASLRRTHCSALPKPRGGE